MFARRVGDVEQVYAGVVRAATITCRYCVPDESHVPVYVGTKPMVPIRELWAHRALRVNSIRGIKNEL